MKNYEIYMNVCKSMQLLTSNVSLLCYPRFQNFILADF